MPVKQASPSLGALRALLVGSWSDPSAGGCCPRCADEKTQVQDLRCVGKGRLTFQAGPPATSPPAALSPACSLPAPTPHEPRQACWHPGGKANALGARRVSPSLDSTHT